MCNTYVMINVSDARLVWVELIHCKNIICRDKPKTCYIKTRSWQQWGSVVMSPQFPHQISIAILDNVSWSKCLQNPWYQNNHNKIIHVQVYLVSAVLADGLVSYGDGTFVGTMMVNLGPWICAGSTLERFIIGIINDVGGNKEINGWFI